jgi:adenosylhomocysteine nucleosidase
MLNFVVALSEEARPIIQQFKLKRRHSINAFPVYGNDDIHLIVTGIGKLAAATATGYLAGIDNADRATAWLNMGVAGCKNLAVGQAVLAHQVVDVVSQQKFYPTIYFDTDCVTAAVASVFQPESEYLDDYVYDMEAVGFYSAALRFSTTELIHSYKIVSDNEVFHVDKVSKGDVVSLIEQSMEGIIQLADVLLSGAGLLDAGVHGKEEFALLNEKFHFTVSQQAQLYTLLQNWFAITASSPLDGLDVDVVRNAKGLLSELQKNIDELPLSYQA